MVSTIIVAGITMSYKFSSKKLVRDKTKERIEAKGGTGSYRTLDTPEYRSELKNKLQEEVLELYNAQTPQQIANEAADVIQVLYDMAAEHNVSSEDIHTAREDRYQRRGGFKNRLYQEWFCLQAEDPELPIILSEPDRYPIID